MSEYYSALSIAAIKGPYMNNVQQFRDLHQQGQCLHIGNVWDVCSALMFEKMGYRALGTSSAAIADSLGYEDGEQMSFTTLLAIVKSIVEVASVPITVDMEGGYSRDQATVLKHMMQLAAIGVVGVNLEDSIVDATHQRTMVDAASFSETIQQIRQGLNSQDIDIFINVRTDAFIMGLDQPLVTSLKRAACYEEAGADGIFVPCVTKESDIQQLVNSMTIPLNIMAMPQLPSFSAISGLGVRRLSSGPFVYQKVKQELGKYLNGINRDQSFGILF